MISEIVFEVKIHKVYEIKVGVQGHKLEKDRYAKTGKFKIAIIKKRIISASTQKEANMEYLKNVKVEAHECEL